MALTPLHVQAGCRCTVGANLYGSASRPGADRRMRGSPASAQGSPQPRPSSARMSLSLGNGARITEHARLDARNTFGVRATAELLVEVTDTSALPELFGYAMLRDPNLLLLEGQQPAVCR